MYYLVAQAIGFIGMALCIGCFQCKSNRLLLLCQMLGNAVYAVHFLMLGAYSGCISALLLVCSNIPVCVTDRAWTKWKGWKWLFCALFILACVFTYQDAFSLLPCAASVAFTLTNYTGNGKVIRRSKLLLVGPGWVIYNIYVHSWSGTLSESIGMLSALISLCRFGSKSLEKDIRDADGREGLTEECQTEQLNS